MIRPLYTSFTNGAYVYIYIYIHTYIHTYIYIYIHVIYVHTHTFVQKERNMPMQIHTRMRSSLNYAASHTQSRGTASLHLYIHTHTHTHTYGPMRQSPIVSTFQIFPMRSLAWSILVYIAFRSKISSSAPIWDERWVNPTISICTTIFELISAGSYACKCMYICIQMYLYMCEYHSVGWKYLHL